MLGKIRRLCDRRLRAPVYWLVLFLLPLEILASIEDHRGYLEDLQTYNQVYHNLEMQQLACLPLWLWSIPCKDGVAGASLRSRSAISC